jgi:serine/threonine protein phosphatase 1
MRTLAIGDVHGCFTAMKLVLDFAKIDPADHVVWLGDYVDRGPDSSLVIEHLVELRSNPNNIFLRGNHELMMERARHELPGLRSWAMCGGDATWDSYSNRYAGDGIHAVPKSHWDFLKGLKRFYETQTHIFVHASLDSETALEDQFDDALFWGDFSSIGPHLSGKSVVCGHTSQKDGVPKTLGHAVCIDTWACGGGWLTCLDVHTGRYWQANQAGETRTDWLSSDCLDAP